MDDFLDHLHGVVILSKIDLKSAYHHIYVKDQDVPKMSFITSYGHYEFMVMPFGLINALATFMTLMNSLFQKHLRRFVLMFIHDIFVYSKSIIEHLEHLRTIFEVLGSNQLYTKNEQM
jgi:hypothetical protein